MSEPVGAEEDLAKLVELVLGLLKWCDEGVCST
jgi:hypothetical protein